MTFPANNLNTYMSLRSPVGLEIEGWNGLGPLGEHSGVIANQLHTKSKLAHWSMTISLPQYACAAVCYSLHLCDSLAQIALCGDHTAMSSLSEQLCQIWRGA